MKVGENKWKIISIVCMSLIFIVILFIILFLSSLSAPNTKIEIKLMDISSDKAVLNVSVSMENKNLFSLMVKNLTAKIIGDGEKKLAEFPLTIGDIPPRSSRNFYGTYEVNFNGRIPQKITIITCGKVGGKLILKKAFDLRNQIDVLLSPIKNISLPSIKISAKMVEINDDGIVLSYFATIANPNFYGIHGKDFALLIKNNASEIYNKSIEEFYVSSNKTFQLNGSIIVPLSILDCRNATIILKGKIWLEIGGIKKELEVESEYSIDIPEIDEIIKFPKYKIVSTLENFDIVSTTPPKIHIKTNLSLEINNPNSFSIVAKNVSISLFSVYYFNEERIGEGFIQGKTIPPHGAAMLTGSFFGDITLFQFWPPFPNPPEIHFHIETALGIKGTKQQIPVEIDFYQVVKI